MQGKPWLWILPGVIAPGGEMLGELIYPAGLNFLTHLSLKPSSKGMVVAQAFNPSPVKAETGRALCVEG